MQILHDLVLRIRQCSEGIALFVCRFCNVYRRLQAFLCCNKRIRALTRNPVIVGKDTSGLCDTLRPEFRVCLVSCQKFIKAMSLSLKRINLRPQCSHIGCKLP
jgi:hypothetical protein